ncbi:transporter substrate-binding domain-containing protein [Vibrio cholerae]|nr:transporter substrate-binding domain-containing protein [Vibrio cholerae]
MKIFLFFLCLISFYTFPSNSSLRTLKVGADVWMPYNGIPDSTNKGYMIDIIEKILSEHNIFVEYTVMPWSRAINETQHNKIDCIIGAGVEDAPNFIFGQEELGVFQAGFYIRNGFNWRYEGMESLKNHRLGAVYGYAYSHSEDFNNFIRRYAYLESGEDVIDRNIVKLIKNRIDIILEDYTVMEYKLHFLNLKDSISLGYLLPDKDKLYLACSPNYKNADEILKYIDVGLREMRDNGQLKIILLTYGLKDWKELEIIK